MYFHFFPEIASAVLKILSQYGLVKCRSPLLKKKKKEDRIFGLVAEKRTAQKMKFSIKDFFRKCDQIHSFLRIWLHLLKKSLMKNFIFYAVALKPRFRLSDLFDLFSGP